MVLRGSLGYLGGTQWYSVGTTGDLGHLLVKRHFSGSRGSRGVVKRTQCVLTGTRRGGSRGTREYTGGGNQWALKGDSWDIQGTQRVALGGLERPPTALKARRTHRILTRDSWPVEAHPGRTLGIFRGAQRGVQRGYSGVHRVLRVLRGTNGTRRGRKGYSRGPQEAL